MSTRHRQAIRNAALHGQRRLFASLNRADIFFHSAAHVPFIDSPVPLKTQVSKFATPSSHGFTRRVFQNPHQSRRPSTRPKDLSVRPRPDVGKAGEAH